MIGSDGGDLYVVDSAGDVVTAQGTGADDTTRASIDFNLPNNVEVLELVSGAIDGHGHAAASVVRGNARDNVLLGLGDSDTLIGEAGADTLRDEDGGDLLVGGVGDDVYTVSGSGIRIRKTDARRATKASWAPTARLDLDRDRVEDRIDLDEDRRLDHVLIDARGATVADLTAADFDF